MTDFITSENAMLRTELRRVEEDLATLRDHLDAVRLASRAPLHEPLVDAVAGLAAVFDEHTRIRDLLGVRPGDDPVEAVRGLVEEVEGLREPLRVEVERLQAERRGAP